MKIHRIDHVGIVVNDFTAAKAFSLNVALKYKGRATYKVSEWSR